MSVSRYHKFLRSSALLCALTLLFSSGLVSPITAELSRNAVLFLASSNTGVSVSVEPTELNLYTAELTARERELDEREADLQGREIAARSYTTSPTTDYTTYILSAILLLLMVLILINYVMDWSRIRHMKYEGTTT